jgi:hypothetical protein
VPVEFAVVRTVPACSRARPVNLPSLQLSSDTQIEGATLQGRPNICDGIATRPRRRANERVEAGLPYIRQVDRVEENGSVAKADFPERIEFEVGFADAAIGVFRERLLPV